MRQRILALLAQGKTYSQIVAELGCAKSTVAYHAKNVKEPPNYKVHDWAEVQKHYDAGRGVNECGRQFGICRSVWYNAIKAGKILVREDYRIPIEVLLSPERKTPRSHVRWRLIGDGILAEVCARCGISEWLGKPLSMHLHHINGIKTDNRLENLQLICPHCHCQTDNYAGRNVNKHTK